jgi:hypothetical protein
MSRAGARSGSLAQVAPEVQRKGIPLNSLMVA